MSIKPIDLQTNMSQMLEVGKNEHARSEALAEQQHLREKESNEKSRLINTRLDESKKGEKTAIKDEEKNREKQKNEEHRENKDAGAEIREKSVDDRIGRIIDVLK